MSLTLTRQWALRTSVPGSQWTRLTSPTPRLPWSTLQTSSTKICPSILVQKRKRLQGNQNFQGNIQRLRLSSICLSLLTGPFGQCLRTTFTSAWSWTAGSTARERKSRPFWLHSLHQVSSSPAHVFFDIPADRPVRMYYKSSSLEIQSCKYIQCVLQASPKT